MTQLKEAGTLSEFLEVIVDKPNNNTPRFRIVALRMPRYSLKENGDDVNISHDQRRFLGFSSPMDIYQNNTKSAIDGAEQMLVELNKTLPTSQ